MKRTRKMAVWAGLAIDYLGFLEPQFRQPLELLSTLARSLSLTEYSTGQFMMKLRPVVIILFVVSLVLSESGLAQDLSSKGRVMSWVPRLLRLSTRALTFQWILPVTPRCFRVRSICLMISEAGHGSTFAELLPGQR